MSRKQRAGRLCRALAQPAVPFYCCEPLEPRTLLSAIPVDGVVGNPIVINGTSGNDTIVLSAHTSRLGLQFFVDWSINGGPTQTAPVRPIDWVLVDTGTGTDTVILQRTAGATIINGHGAGDVLQLGNTTNGMQGIGSQVTINDSAGGWNVTAADTADTTARTATLSDGLLTGLAPGDIKWTDGQVKNIEIDTSAAGGNTLSVLQTDVPTAIQGHSTGPDDSLTVGSPTDGVKDITGGVAIGNLLSQSPSGLWNTTIDDQNDPSFRNYILDDGSLAVIDQVGTSKANIIWNSHAVRDFTLKTEPMPAGGEVDVRSTDVPTTIVTGSDRSVKVGNPLTNGVLGIQRNLYVSDPAGFATLAVSQIGDSTPRTVTLHTISVPGDSAAYGAIDGLAPATIAYKYADVLTVGLQLGGASNAPAAVHIAATETAVLIGGAASVVVGDAGSLQNIAGPLSISGGSLTVDDSADPISRNATISLLNVGANPVPAVAIGGLSPSIQSQAATLVINGGTGANAYTVDAPPLTLSMFVNLPHFGVVLNTGSGNDTVNVVASAFGAPLTINGQGGSDTFTVNYSNSITDNLIFNGGTGSDTLMLIGPTANAQFSLTASTVNIGALTTTYTAVKTLALTTGIFTITGDLSGVNLSTSGFTTAKFQTSAHLGALSIGGGAQVTLTPGGMPLSNTLFCTGLSIADSGKLDLANNSLQLNYTGADPIAAVRSYLDSGYSNGSWNGNGLTTSAGDATHGLGLADAADGVVPDLPANTLLVRWTRYGDVNLDGKVGFADLVAVARNYGKAGLNWDQGDVNYDGAVGFDDLIAVARNYGATAALQSAAAMLAAAPLEIPIKTRRRR